MRNFVVSKSSDAFVVLETPASKVVSGHVLEIAVEHFGRVVGDEGHRPVAHYEQGVLGEHAFDVVTVAESTHHGGNQVQAVLPGGFLEGRGSLRRHVPG